MMSSEIKTPGTLTAIHTDFGNNSGDLLVVEYDVPQTKVKQTLFYKYGQLSIPKWALIPAGILAFGLLTALFAIILNSILSQSATTVTYSQTCSKTSKCKSDVGLTCGSQSKCVCSTKQYWYEKACVDQPTYTEQCNQTTECRTDLGLICAEIEGQCNCPTFTKVHTCDCPSTSYWTGSSCTPRSGYLGACNIADSTYECISSLYCDGTKCACAPNTQYWNVTASACYSVDKYLALCDPLTSYSCDASVSLYCLSAGLGSQCPLNVTANSTSCDCANGTYWTGGSCATKKTINSACFWNCECDSNAGLQCLNMSCVCPNKYHWSTSLSSCQTQMNYTQSPCNYTSDCDTTQGLTCYVSGSACNCPITSSLNMCDCLKTQYYDYNLTSCQTLKLYNETCDGNYMCDSAIGLFCQLNISTATNCSCPEPIRMNMCDCNMSSYWDGVACVSRLSANISCSFEYQCQTGLTCIVNQTDNGIFSDVCRCPLGSYYGNGNYCIPSINYTQPCIGTYQCYELAPLSCRYIDTTLTCLDASTYALPACDCEDNYYYNATLGICIARLDRLEFCDDYCQCNPPYECISNQCNCPDYYSSLNKTCVDNLRYGDQCTNSADCEATFNTFMTCINGTCACNSTGFWNGTQCLFTTNYRAVCQSNSGCSSGLECKQISCIGSSSRCSCPANYYYSPSSQSCLLCSGAIGYYKKYVINYPASDLCVAIRVPTGTSSITFSAANSECTSLSAMVPGNGPQLLSVHNQTELNCIASLIKANTTATLCNNRVFYLGLNSTSLIFYDGTPYSVFSSPTASTTRCLTYCLGANGNGYLVFNSCSSMGSIRYGAICDYQIL